MSFDINEFLQEYGTQFDDSFRGDVMPMKMQSGFGVFAGNDSKFFPALAKPLVQKAKKDAEAYAEKLGTGAKVYACVQQTWYAEMIGREKQPNWKDGKWEEMKRRTVIQVNDEWKETGDWAVFSSQWTGDNPPVTNDDFGKKLWVHVGYERHPDFDIEFPNKYTAQMQGGEFVLDNEGKPRPQYLRVVREIIGDDKTVAEKWYAEHKEAEGETAVSAAEVTVSDRLKEIGGKINMDDDTGLVMSCLEDIYSALVNGSSVDEKMVEDWATVGKDEETGVAYFSKDVLNEVAELAKKYGAF